MRASYPEDMDRHLGMLTQRNTKSKRQDLPPRNVRRGISRQIGEDLIAYGEAYCTLDWRYVHPNCVQAHNGTAHHTPTNKKGCALCKAGHHGHVLLRSFKAQ